MKRLSEKNYWDLVYKNIIANNSKVNLSFLSKFKNLAKHISRDYSNYILSELYFKYLPKFSNLKMIEIGCASGRHLINFHRQFGYKPYGVEYSEDGYLLTRNNFLKEGINPENIIKADFFDEEFQSQNQKKYDLVFSRGFVEHFDDVDKVINDHIKLLSDKGYLIVSIPNIRGLNYSILKLSNYNSWITHNFSIMDNNVFYKLFENKDLDFLYCDYVGTFSFGLFNTNKKWKYYLQRFFLIAQRPFDFIWRVVFGNRHIKNKYTSPYLLFIGKKK